MRGQGIHYALDVVEQAVMREIRTNGARFCFLEIIMRHREKRWYQLTDKAWEGIHRCLAGGTFDYKGATPLSRCILAGANLYRGEPQTWYISYLDAKRVKKVAAALKPINKSWMQRQYRTIDPKEYGWPLSDEDFEYTWEWFLRLRRFYARAATHDRAVVFKGEMLH
jgi:hypothetical protein